MEGSMERIIDVTAARRQFGTLLDEVFYRGDVVTIERKGKPLAKIVPIEGQNNQISEIDMIIKKQKMMLEELNNLPSIGVDQDPVEVLRKMRKEKRIKATTGYGK